MIQAIALLIISLVVIFLVITTLRKYKRISNEGIEAEGIVYDFESSQSNNNSTITFPIIRFLTEKNEWITQKASISSVPFMYKKGQQIKVVYLKEKPTDFFIKSNNTQGVLFFMIFVSSALAVYAIYILLQD